jgi:hypothetical protein
MTSISSSPRGVRTLTVSLLPNPKRTYFSATEELSKGWAGYLHRVLKIVRGRNKINDAALEA